MELKICQNCKSPFLANQPDCPRCGKEYVWNPDSYLNAGCLMLMLLLAFLMMLLPVLLLAGMLLG